MVPWPIGVIARNNAKKRLRPRQQQGAAIAKRENQGIFEARDSLCFVNILRARCSRKRHPMINPIRGVAAVLSIAVVAMAWPTASEAGGRYRVPYSMHQGGGPEGRGCYWFRQRLYCSRYCYVEIDGRRYCQERARWAYPQAPYYDDVEPRHRPVK